MPTSKSGPRSFPGLTAGTFLGCLLAITPAQADDNIVQVDWETRTAACPAKVTQSTRATVRVTGVNDVLIDFKTNQRAEYQFRAKGTPVSVAPENPLGITQTAMLTCPTEDQFKKELAAIRDINDSLITPPPGGASTRVVDTVDAARSNRHPEVIKVEEVIGACNDLGSLKDPIVEWVKRLSGPHQVDFHVNLEPNQNYEFTLTESWKGQKTKGGTMTWRCGEADIFTLSAGPLVTTLPYRSYDHQKAPVPAGSSTTQDILAVGGNSSVNALGAALLNFHLPPMRFLPAWTGLAISAGPVYTLGDTAKVSALGLFVGASIHLYRSMFLTPGIHIGEFADFPVGFFPGAVIPDKFGDLNPIKRKTAHFAIGLTFKTNSFKKSSQDGGAAKNTGADKAGGDAGKPSQEASGSKGEAPKQAPKQK